MIKPRLSLQKTIGISISVVVFLGIMVFAGRFVITKFFDQSYNPSLSERESVQPTEPLGDNPCSDAYDNPPPPLVWRVATSTGLNVSIEHNALIMNGATVVENIPLSLGLPKADGVGLDGFFGEFAKGPVCDYYSPIIVSKDGRMIAFEYGRYIQSSDPNPDFLQASTSILFVYDRTGKLVYKKDTGSNHPPAFGDLSFPNSHAVVVTEYIGKEGDSGTPIAYFLNGTVVELPNQSGGTYVMSSDAHWGIYDNMVYDDSCAIDGLDQWGSGDLRLFDMKKATSTSILCGATKSYYPLGWFGDSFVVAVVSHVNFAFETFFTFNSKTKNITYSTSSKPFDALVDACRTTFDCSEYLQKKCKNMFVCPSDRSAR